MEKVLVSVFGYVLGFGFSNLVWGRAEGAAGWVPNFRFSAFGWQISIHHWMGFGLLLVILLLVQARFNLLSERWYYFGLGFLFGGLNQGLTFKDWHIIVR